MKSLIVTTVFLTTALQASATIVVQEQFLASEYTANTDVIGQGNGAGIGTNGAWNSGDTFAATVRFDPVSSDLTYPDFDSAAGSLDYYRNGGSSGFVKEISRPLSYTAPTVDPSNDYYIAFMFNPSAHVGTELRYAIQLDENGDSDDPDMQWIYVADNTRSDFVFIRSGAEIRVNNVAADTTHLMLARVSHEDATDNLVEMWLDPDLNNLGPAAGSITMPKNRSSVAFDELNIVSALTAGENVVLDEITIFTDLSDVVIPEPRAYAMLAGLAALGLLWRRRR